MSQQFINIKLKVVVPAVMLCATAVTNPLSAAPGPVNPGKPAVNPAVNPADNPINPTQPRKPVDPVAPAMPVAPSVPAKTPVQEDPCGKNLVRMGHKTAIYNNSKYQWNVVFATEWVWLWLPAFRSVNAGVVKYLDNGKWIDTGYGNNKKKMEYTIPVAAGKTVPIAYCADKSFKTTYLKGSVEFFPRDTDFAGTRPGNGITFYASNGRSGGDAPIFNVNEVTPYVNYNRNNTKALEDGSVTICPNDSECKKP